MSPEAAAARPKLLAGSTAEVTGVKSKPELNGCPATIGSYIESKGRYNIRTSTGVEVALKPENLLQEAADRLPPASTVEADEYPIQDVLDVMDINDTVMAEYNADVAVACLTRCVESLMEGPNPDLPESRVLVAAMNAMLANARNDGAAPQLFGIAVLNFPFLLGSREKVADVDKVEAELNCSLLMLLVKGFDWYAPTHELLSSTMIAVRQLLSCWVDDDDSEAGIDDERLQAVRDSGLLPSLVKMLDLYPPSLADEGTLELHEHAIAAFSSVCGLAPSDARAAAIAEAGAIAPTLKAMRAVAGAADAHGAKGAKKSEEVEAALELVRSGGALLKALGSSVTGRDGLRRNDTAKALEELMKALPLPEVLNEIGALKALIQSKEGRDAAASPAVAAQKVGASQEGATKQSQGKATAPQDDSAISATYYY